MLSVGVPVTSNAKKVMMLGSGELGKEVVIELQRLGVEVIAIDRYAGAPAMQVAHRYHVIDMQNASVLRAIIEKEKPDLIVPEVEAIATDELAKLESDGFQVIPTARATQLTMDREGIRKLAAEELDLPTSPYAFAADEESYLAAIEAIGVPCVVKPVMSSSGKGQSIVRDKEHALEGWTYALSGSRGKSQRVIIEGFVPFDTEITLLTVRHAGGTSYCPPVGHRQVGGDYRESWQPEALPASVLEEAERQAKVITDALGGLGLFGVEFFIQGDKVFFSELSPRPHDTGMVTMITQELSEFALHARAILGLPIPEIKLWSAGASHAVLASEHGAAPTITVDPGVLETPGTDLRIFGKPNTRPGRRMAVGLARAETTDEARAKAEAVAAGITVEHTKPKS